MKKIKILILIFVLLIIGIIITIVFININNKTPNNQNETLILTPEDKIGYEVGPESFGEPDKPIELKIEPELKNVEDNLTFFTIKALTNNYISTLISGDKEQIKLLLAPSYIKKYNIDDNNLLKISKIPQSNNLMYKIIIKDMKEFTINNGTKEYIVNGKVRLLENNKIFSYEIMIEVNVSEKTYYIYPENYVKDKKLNTLKVGDKISYNSENEKIENNNKFEYLKEKSEAEIAIQYMYDIKELLLYYKDDAYNILNEEYRNKRFKNKQTFYKYINDNKLPIALMSAEKYKTIKNNNYTDYIISDIYNNVYIVRQKEGYNNYDVFLDNYTIITSEDMENYKKYDDLNKAKYNVTKFIKMINSKDYNTIYNLLSNTFKNNNFKTENDLEKYIKKNFYDINSIQIIEEKEFDTYCAFKCKLVNKRNEKETKTISIIVSKTNDTNFTMSFSAE